MSRRPFLTVLFIIVLLATGWFFGSKATGGDDVLASAGAVTVDTEEFRQHYVRFLLRSGLPDSPRLRKTFIDDHLAGKLLIDEARKSGIEEDPEYSHRHELVRRKVLVDTYARGVLFDTLTVPEVEVQEMFMRSQTQVLVRHLFARTSALADELHRRLLSGERFESLAEEVFADPALSQSGGSLGWIGFDEMDPDFEDVAFSLGVGSVSEPVRTAYGYSIIRVDDRFTKPLSTELEYAKRRANLIAYVRERKEALAQRRHSRNLLTELSPAFDDSSLGQLINQISGRDVFESEEAFERLAAQSLVEFGPVTGRTVWTVGEFRQHALYTSEEQRAQVRSRHDLTEFIGGLIVRDTMMKRAVERGWDREENFSAALDASMNEYILDQIRTKFASDVDVPEDSIRAFFDSAPPEKFMQPRLFRVSEIIVASREEAELIRGQLEYTAFSELARRFTLRPDGKESGGDLGFLTEDQMGPVKDALLATHAGEIVGPLTVNNGFGLYRIEDQMEAREKSYSESRSEISDMLHFQYRRELMRRQLDSVLERSPVYLNSDLLYSTSLEGESEM